jgi:VanZ family protein
MSKKSLWGLALGYVGFIYATLGVIRLATNALRNLGILNLTVVCGYILVVGICLLLLIRSRTRDWWRYAVLVGALSSYYFLAENLRAPEEKIHFFEYGLVGILFFRALQAHVKKPWAALIGALILGAMAGWLDEVIQKFVPGRYYDVRDIFINIESVALGLVIWVSFPHSQPKSPNV